MLLILKTLCHTVNIISLKWKIVSFSHGSRFTFFCLEHFFVSASSAKNLCRLEPGKKIERKSGRRENLEENKT